MVGKRTGGVGVEVNDLSLSTGNIKDSKLKKCQIIEASQETIEKLLSGKIRRKLQLEKLKELTEKQDNTTILNEGQKAHQGRVKFHNAGDWYYPFDYSTYDEDYFIIKLRKNETNINILNINVYTWNNNFEYNLYRKSI